MSRSRQTREPALRAIAVTWSAATTWRSRRSEWGQLIYASRGMITAQTVEGLWVMPPHQGLWVPAGVTHSIEGQGPVALRAVYLNRSSRKRLPQRCRVVEISPLLKELLRKVQRLRTLDLRVTEQRHLLQVLLDQLTMLPTAPVDLLLPQDPRGARAAALIRAVPSARHTLAEVGREAGASARTLERVFRTETGLSFGAWRQRARLVRALQLLADGGTVTQTALAVGYDSTSAFVAAFRRALGVTPGRYYRRPDADQP